MSYEFTVDDVAFLRSAQGAQALADCAHLGADSRGRIADVAAARRLVGEWHAAAVLETVLLRSRASAKITSPQGWLFTDQALQQASASTVAAHRAARLAGRDVHDVTCSVGADLVELAGRAARCTGSDLDPVRLGMAAHNCADAGVAPAVLRADALRPVTAGTVVVADPARRDAGGRRSWRPGDFVPALDELAEVYTGRELVVKTAPGIDPDVAPWAGEVELVSLDGQLREACLFGGELAEVSRRASVLRSDGTQWSLSSDDPDDVGAAEPGRWIIDPDPAVVRAGLVRHFGARHGLWQLDERIAYLTGDEPPPGIRAFEVLEHGHYTEKALREVLRRNDAGSVEILVRGLDVDPNTLRRRLKLRGSQAFSIVLTRIGRSPVAFLCRARAA